MNEKMQRIGIVPACNLDHFGRQWILFQRLNDCETASIDEERVVAQYIPKLWKGRMIIRNDLRVDLLKDRSQSFGTQFSFPILPVR